MTLAFLPPHDPRLGTAAPAVPVDSITNRKVQDIIEQLYDVAMPERADRRQAVMVGLAAPQVGLHHRIILVDTAADGHGTVGELKAFINPVVTSMSDNTEEWYEGCYSTSRICGIVARPREITIAAFNTKGESVTETHSGYAARIFQHEIDHLDGRVFVERISNPRHLHHVDVSDFPAYRDNEGWRTWHKLSSPAAWEKLRSTGSLDQKT